MCGIFALLNNNGVVSDEFIKKQFLKGKSRGPDNTTLNITNDIYIGFHRLSINGLDAGSNQPFRIHNIELICNGEIYNYKELFDKFFLDHQKLKGRLRKKIFQPFHQRLFLDPT